MEIACGIFMRLPAARAVLLLVPCCRSTGDRVSSHRANSHAHRVVCAPGDAQHSTNQQSFNLVQDVSYCVSNAASCSARLCVPFIHTESTSIEPHNFKIPTFPETRPFRWKVYSCTQVSNIGVHNFPNVLSKLTRPSRLVIRLLFACCNTAGSCVLHFLSA